MMLDYRRFKVLSASSEHRAALRRARLVKGRVLRARPATCGRHESDAHEGRSVKLDQFARTE